jgi:hypothetical protein
LTGVRISRTGRPQRYCPLRGVGILTFPCTPIVQVILCAPTNRRAGGDITLRLFLAHTWAFPPNRRGRTCTVATRGLTGPVPCRSSTLSRRCVLVVPEKTHHPRRPPLDTLSSPRSESQGPPRALRRVTAPGGQGLIVRLIRRRETTERRGTSSVRFSHRFLQTTPPRTRPVLRGYSPTPQREVGPQRPHPRAADA